MLGLSIYISLSTAIIKANISALVSITPLTDHNSIKAIPWSSPHKHKTGLKKWMWYNEHIAIDASKINNKRTPARWDQQQQKKNDEWAKSIKVKIKEHWIEVRWLNEKE